jgi:hypothetical protein
MMSMAALQKFSKRCQFGGLRPGKPSRHSSSVNGVPLPSADSSATLGNRTPPFASWPASGT